MNKIKRQHEYIMQIVDGRAFCLQIWIMVTRNLQLQECDNTTLLATLWNIESILFYVNIAIIGCIILNYLYNKLATYNLQVHPKDIQPQSVV